VLVEVDVVEPPQPAKIRAAAIASPENEIGAALRAPMPRGAPLRNSSILELLSPEKQASTLPADRNWGRHPRHPGRVPLYFAIPTKSLTAAGIALLHIRLHW
jgi:hypothetical protein